MRSATRSPTRRVARPRRMRPAGTPFSMASIDGGRTLRYPSGVRALRANAMPDADPSFRFRSEPAPGERDGVAEARRAYWQAQMDEAYAFMLECLEQPLTESGEQLIELAPSSERAGVEVRFSERPHVHGLPRIFVLREGQIEAFNAAAAELNANGWIMRVEDGYRSVEMQHGLATNQALLAAIMRSLLAETDGVAPDADLLFRRVSALVATRPRVATHMSGSAIDISVLERSSGGELDRGAPYLEMSALTPMASPFVSPAQAEARGAITALMARHGFLAYPYEFWHYSSGDVFAARLGSGVPSRYGPVSYDARSRRCEPLPAEGFVTTAEQLQSAVSSASALAARAS